MNAENWKQKLQLKAHPEGGFYREIYRSDESIAGDALPARFGGNRKFATSIYYFLGQNDFSAFHKIKQDEIWHHYDGGCCELFILFNDGSIMKKLLGKDAGEDCTPQVVIPRNTWFAARPAQNVSFCLMGCTVSPGFDFDDFHMADVEELAAEFPSHEQLIKSFQK